MQVEGIIHRRHQDGFIGNFLDGQARHFGGGKDVGDQRQVRAVLLHGSNRQNGHAILRHGFSNFGPGEFFVAIL